MRLTLHVWRQKGPAGHRAASPPTSSRTSAPTCRSSRCSTCSTRTSSPAARSRSPSSTTAARASAARCGMVINGVPHGGQRGTTVCQLHMRHFKDGDELVLEPWRAKAFPVLKDLVVDRSAFDRIIQAGGFISARIGSAPDANAVPIAKDAAEPAMDFAECIGCGACVAACPNGAAMLFVGAKIAHLGLLPQGQPERAAAGRRRWSSRWNGRRSAPAPTSAPARRPARRRSRSRPSPS